MWRGIHNHANNMNYLPKTLSSRVTAITVPITN